MLGLLSKFMFKMGENGGRFLGKNIVIFGNFLGVFWGLKGVDYATFLEQMTYGMVQCFLTEIVCLFILCVGAMVLCFVRRTFLTS